ncbi:MAG: hypothetical protein JO147_06260 [Actinobacteria bacterium]|nr:hypothetical protein [Actinomycetota bacterium]
MTEEEFADLTAQYIAATERRLDLIKREKLNTPSALSAYRELADQEWELGLAWDAELERSFEERSGH